jgi:hypothetical protein
MNKNAPPAAALGMQNVTALLSGALQGKPAAFFWWPSGINYQIKFWWFGL